VLERSGEVPSLAVALSSTADLIESHVDATAANGVDWGGGGGLPLTAFLSHFPDLRKDEMKVY
jgi:hypothetical protein